MRAQKSIHTSLIAPFRFTGVLYCDDHLLLLLAPVILRSVTFLFVTVVLLRLYIEK